MSSKLHEHPELKAELSIIQIEALKWHQRLQEITYLEAGQHMRALNQLMWQVPSLVIIINGGLWYGLTMMNNHAAHFIFLFCLLFDFTSIITLYRLRKLIGDKIKIQSTIESSYNENILNEITKRMFKEYNAPLRNEKEKTQDLTAKQITNRTKIFDWIIKTSDGNYTVISCWTAALSFCIVINAIGAICPSLFLDNEPKKVKHEFFIDKPYVIMDTNKL